MVYVVMATQERSNQCKDDRTPRFINCMDDHDDPSVSRRLSCPSHQTVQKITLFYIQLYLKFMLHTNPLFLYPLWTQNQPKVNVSPIIVVHCPLLLDRSLFGPDRSKLVSISQCQLGNKDLNI